MIVIAIFAIVFVLLIAVIKSNLITGKNQPPSEHAINCYVCQVLLLHSSFFNTLRKIYCFVIVGDCHKFQSHHWDLDRDVLLCNGCGRVLKRGFLK